MLRCLQPLCRSSCGLESVKPLQMNPPTWIGAAPKGCALQQRVLSILWKPLPLLRAPSENTFLFKTHYKTPSKNPFENLLQIHFENVRTPLSEPLLEWHVLSYDLVQACTQLEMSPSLSAPFPLTPPRWQAVALPFGPFCSSSLCNFLRSDIVVFLDFSFMEGFSQRQNSAEEEGLKKMVIFRPGGGPGTGMPTDCKDIALFQRIFGPFLLCFLGVLSLCGLFTGVVKAAMVWGRMDLETNTRDFANRPPFGGS